MTKFDAGYFDEDFYKGEGKGAVRNEDSPHYHFFTARVRWCLQRERMEPNSTRILDIGCGIGWEPCHYLNAGYDAYGVDVSEWAYSNSVLPPGRKFVGDVRKLDKVFKSSEVFNLVVANRILAYLPSTGQIVRGMRQIVKLSSRFICFAIICSDHKGTKVQQWTKGSGRLTYMPKAWYEKWFKKLGLKLHKEYTDYMLQGDWDCVWFLEKGE